MKTLIKGDGNRLFLGTRRVPRNQPFGYIFVEKDSPLVFGSGEIVPSDERRDEIGG
jgi:hypothetical protein